MSEQPTPPAANTPPPPAAPARRVRRWPTAVVTFLLTLSLCGGAAYYVWRKLPDELPRQEWWVRQDPKAFTDTRTQGAYVEAVLFSKLADESKVKLIREGIRQKVFHREQDNWYPPVEGAWDGFEAGGRFPYLWKPLVKLVTDVLADPNAKPAAQSDALHLLNDLIGKARDDLWPPQWNAGDFFARRSFQVQLANATPHLVRFLTDPLASAEHRREAVRAFARIGARHADVQVFPTAELVACLADPDPDTRLLATQALAAATGDDRPVAVRALLNRFAQETVSEVRCEVVYCLGQFGPTVDADPRPDLVAFLNTPRPPTPKGNESSPRWTADLEVRTHVVVALGWMTPTPEGDRAVIATLRQREVSRGWDCPTLAAAVYLGRSRNPDAGPALLAAFREQFAADRVAAADAARRQYSSNNARFSALFTYARALLDHRETARTALVELIRVVPTATYTVAIGLSSQPPLPTFQSHVPPAPPLRMDCERRFPAPRASLWSPVALRWDVQGLVSAVDALGPPAEADAPELWVMLRDKDTTAGECEVVAKMLVKYVVSISTDAQVALEKMRDEPTTHPQLVAAVKAELEKRKPPPK